ncbi:ANTAR domain-containing protein [Hamadaea sp. NPDC051192]|uniref:ANTAR domain-containing protein n=1 Tax=Hamadaea sp. NPDC051192 TaxID=3154940 RepID=UPI00344A4083
MTDQTRVARAFAGIARCVLAESSAAEVLQVFADSCAAAVGVPSVGVSVGPVGDCPPVMAASDERAHVLEDVAAGAGPTPARYVRAYGRSLVNTRLLPRDGRWPAVAERALAAGIGLVTVLPLRDADEILGTVTLYCEDWVGLEAPRIEVAEALAVTATAVLIEARRRDAAAARARRLSVALDQRVRIEEAVGRLAERWNVTPDEAYERMRRDTEERDVPLETLVREAAAVDRW